MDISDKQLNEFRELYFLRFNKKLSEEEALIMTRKFLCLIKEIYKKINN